MIHAYDSIYLYEAQMKLGSAFDVAVNYCMENLKDFYQKFLKSEYSIGFAQGDPAVLAGMSGVELAYSVLGEKEEKEINQPLEKSEEYWTGWALAYYQWYSGVSFQMLEEEISIETIRNLYSPFHEMDLDHLVVRINELRMAKRCMSYLKLFRTRAGLTQKELAKETEIPLKTIQQYEQKQKNINKAQSEYVIKFARVLGCKPEQLLEIE